MPSYTRYNIYMYVHKYDFNCFLWYGCYSDSVQTDLFVLKTVHMQWIVCQMQVELGMQQTVSATYRHEVNNGQDFC
jgi:hypothetical protein